MASIIFEPIQGEGGYVIPPPGYFQRLKKLADKYDLLLIDDEVQAGMGRTGKMFGSEQFGVSPDIMALAKGIASGMPLGAMVARADIMDWEAGSHASTFGGNPISCQAAMTTIELLEQGLMANAAAQGERLIRGLRELQKSHECMGDVRGKGLGGEALFLLFDYGFREMNLHKIWCEVYDSNASVNLYRRLGFQDDGVLRDNYFHGGKYGNSIMMSVLEDEWFAANVGR